MQLTLLCKTWILAVSSRMVSRSSINLFLEKSSNVALFERETCAKKVLHRKENEKNEKKRSWESFLSMLCCEHSTETKIFQRCLKDLIRKWVKKHVGASKKNSNSQLHSLTPHRYANFPEEHSPGPQQAVLTRCETITKNTLQTSALFVSMDIHTNFERSCLLFHERCNNTEQQFISERVTRFVLCNGM